MIIAMRMMIQQQLLLFPNIESKQPITYPPFNSYNMRENRNGCKCQIIFFNVKYPVKIHGPNLLNLYDLPCAACDAAASVCSHDISILNAHHAESGNTLLRFQSDNHIRFKRAVKTFGDNGVFVYLKPDSVTEKPDFDSSSSCMTVRYISEGIAPVINREASVF